MSEFRCNPLLRTWTMVGSNRQQRPHLPRNWCPFCPGSGKVPDDYDVLKSLNLAKTSPLIIQFEHGLLSPQEIDDAVNHLHSCGYRILYGGHQLNDTVALHSSFPLLDS